MRIIGSLLMLVGLAYAGLWAWNNQPQVRQFVEKQLNSSEFHTLEARLSAQQIMENQKGVLLKDEQHKYLKPQLLFYPYLLMEVKYLGREGATKEGVILWGLDDGEMVLNTRTWEKTHGFQDCLTASADRSDFRILQTLSRNSGSATREQLVESLHVDTELLDSWLEKCRKKQLIVKQGGSYRLHFERPRIDVDPATRLDQGLVTKPQKQAVRIGKNYSASQIKKVAQAAFGGDFAIRSTREIFLPVYRIEVQNPDGSIATSYWNTLTSKQVSDPYLN